MIKITGYCKKIVITDFYKEIIGQSDPEEILRSIILLTKIWGKAQVFNALSHHGFSISDLTLIAERIQFQNEEIQKYWIMERLENHLTTKIINLAIEQLDINPIMCFYENHT